MSTKPYKIFATRLFVQQLVLIHNIRNIKGQQYWPSCRKVSIRDTWWRHQMKTFSALLAICAGNSPAFGEFPAQRPLTRCFDVFFDLCQNKRLRKQSWGWWFETLSRPLWRHCNDGLDIYLFKIIAVHTKGQWVDSFHHEWYTYLLILLAFPGILTKVCKSATLNFYHCLMVAVCFHKFNISEKVHKTASMVNIINYKR